jgi:hypothetical protein
VSDSAAKDHTTTSYSEAKAQELAANATRGGVTPEVKSAAWDYGDVYDGPWYVFREPRDEHRLAIKSGHFTILTVGDYFDGGGPIEERLEWLCGVVNREVAKSELGVHRG